MSNRQLKHYKKVKITKEISLRYFYTYQDKQHLEKKWSLAMNAEDNYSIFTLEGIEVLKMLHDFDVKNYKEIIEVTENNIHYKTILKAKGKAKTFSKKIRIKN